MAATSAWTVSDELSLAQTVVLFLTGVVLLWYTFETHRMRRASERQTAIAEKQASVAQQQAELAGRQFALSQEQSALTRAAMESAEQERIRDSEPILDWMGGAGSASEYYREFENLGSIMNSLYVQTKSPVEGEVNREVTLIATVKAE